MTIHLHDSWNFGDPITEELIDKIVEIVKANSFAPFFAITSIVDKFAWIFMEKMKLEDILKEVSKEPHSTQLKEIYLRVQSKL